MNRLYYYLVLVVAFLTLWALIVTLFFVMKENGYKAGSVLYVVAFSIMFGILGSLKTWLKKKFKIK